MKRRARVRGLAFGIVMIGLALIVLGLPEHVVAGKIASMTTSAKTLVMILIMGMFSTTMLLTWSAIASRMLERTKKSVARIETRQG